MNVEVPSNTLVKTERSWYYLEDGKQKGPIPESLISKMLEEKILGPETLIWSESMTDWIRASDVDTFKANLTLFPPPVPQTAIQTPTEPEIRKLKDGVSQIRPWVRYWARSCDIYLFAIPFGVLLGILYPPIFNMPEFLLGILMIFAWIFLEAWLLSTWGTTPGKWLLKTTVRASTGRKLTYSESLTRSFLVWVKGFGIGIPIVALITLVVAHARLKREGITSWDKEVGSMVTHERIGEFRTVVTAFLLLGFFFLIMWGSIK